MNDEDTAIISAWSFANETMDAIRGIDWNEVAATAHALAKVRERGGRVFVLGVGGSAANASHFVNDLRKLCGIEAYAPTDNVSELTARVNDSPTGWQMFFKDYLITSNLTPKDLVFFFSVGGGDEERNISVNLIEACKYAYSVGTTTACIVGRTRSFLYRNTTYANAARVNEESLVTPISEALQAVIWHAIVSSPVLQQNKTTW